MEYAGGLGVTLAQHPENESLSEGGHMHEGAMSSVLGIPGIPAEAEELMVMRDVTLCRLTGAKVHFQHLSTAGSIGIVSAAKNSGLSITAEIAPHHFTLTDRCVESYDSLYKVNPPLRTAQDVAAVRLALADSVVDAITSDHAPHEPHLKELPFDEAPCGMIGLETALALAMTELDMDIGALLALLSWQPAAIAGIEHCHGGPIAPGRPANIAVIDPAATWVVSGREMASRSSNTPYEGRELTGRVRHTIVHGEPMVIDGEAQR
jgi:dihydroorotase